MTFRLLTNSLPKVRGGVLGYLGIILIFLVCLLRNGVPPLLQIFGKFGYSCESIINDLLAREATVLDRRPHALEERARIWRTQRDYDLRKKVNNTRDDVNRMKEKEREHDEKAAMHLVERDRVNNLQKKSGNRK